MLALPTTAEQADLTMTMVRSAAQPAPQAASRPISASTSALISADDGFIRDPSLSGTCSATDRTACFPGNIIPASRITPDGLAMANVYRTMIPLAASYRDEPVGNNATYQLDNPFDWRQDIIRMDYRFNDSQSIYVRYLHDVFDLDFDEIATRLQRTPAAVRQLASRARQRVKADYARREVAAEEGTKLLQAFGLALARGDVDGLARLLVEDAEFLSDGGGVVNAVPQPLRGAARIARAMVGFGKLADWSRMRVKLVTVNGMQGWLQYDMDGTPIQTLALRLADDGRVAGIYVVRNPHKLQHLRQPPE